MSQEIHKHPTPKLYPPAELPKLKIHSLDSATTGFVDGMGVSIENAREAAAHGWNPKSVEWIRKYVDRWNKLLGTKVECVFESSKPNLGNSQSSNENSSQAGISDGKINFTCSFAEIIIEAPNVVIGHECGHELERKLNPLGGGTTKGLKAQQAFTTPGFDDPSGIHPCPPFGAALSHSPDLLSIFCTTGLQSTIGYNARQIYCDSVPLREILIQLDYKTPPYNPDAWTIIDNSEFPVPITDMERKRKKVMGMNPLDLPLGLDMATEAIQDYIYRRKVKKGLEIPFTTLGGFLAEWEKLLEGQYAVLSSEIREKGLKVWADSIPAIARFSASAWGLQRLIGIRLGNNSSREITDKAERHMHSLEGIFTKFGRLLEEPINSPGLTDKQIIELFKIPHDSQTVILSQKDRNSGLDEKLLRAVAVLTRAYKEHFINCLGLPEVFKGERVEVHLEKLESTDDTVRINEIKTMGSLGDAGFFDPLRKIYEDPKESKQVRGETLKAMVNIAVKNIYNTDVGTEFYDKAHPILAKASRNKDDDVMRFNARVSIGSMMHPDLEILREGLQDPNDDNRASAAGVLSKISHGFHNYYEYGDRARYINEKNRQDMMAILPELCKIARQDSSWVARQNAVQAIGGLGERAASAELTLIKALWDKSGFVAREACTSLANVSPASRTTRDALKNAIKNRTDLEEWEDMRGRAKIILEGMEYNYGKLD
jgi:HEAT repeat protein